MRALSFLAPLASLALALGVGARSSTGDRVLVLFGPQVKQEEYGGFFGSLESECAHLYGPMP